MQYEGLYGTPDLQSAALAADRLLLFAGGAGITPVASVLQALLAAPLGPLPAAWAAGGVGVRARGADGSSAAEMEAGVVPEAASGCPHVHLVWAVTQQVGFIGIGSYGERRV